jgi:hypothetical protein
MSMQAQPLRERSDERLSDGLLRRGDLLGIPAVVLVPPARAGVYMLCRRDRGRLREIVYIGETADLASRLGPEHEHWAEAQALGVNEVLVHLLAMTSDERRAVTARLRRLHPTPLNGLSPALAAG